MAKLGFGRKSGVQEEDLVEGARGVEGEPDVFTRWVIEVDPVGYQLNVRCEIYREASGVRTGLSKNVSVWSPGNRPLMSAMLIALHRAYAGYEQLAHRK